MIGMLLLILGGILLGGAWSFARQRKPWWAVAILGILAVMAVVAGFLRL